MSAFGREIALTFNIGKALSSKCLTPVNRQCWSMMESTSIPVQYMGITLSSKFM